MRSMTDIHDPGNIVGYKTNSIFAFISRDAEGNEGLCGCDFGGVKYAMICSGHGLPAMELAAREMAHMTDKEIVLVEFTSRKQVRVIGRDQ